MLIYFSLIVKEILFAYLNDTRIRSCIQPVLTNEGKVSCSRKQLKPLMGLRLTTDRHPPTTIKDLDMLHY